MLPGVIYDPVITKLIKLAVKTRPATMSTGFDIRNARFVIGAGLLLIKNILEKAKLIKVPKMVTSTSLKRSVIPTTMTFKSSAISVWSVIVTNSRLAEVESRLS